MTLFNKYAGTKFEAKVPSFDTLDAAKAKTGRVCPLICEFGYRADGDRCIKIMCRVGFRPTDDGSCERQREREKPEAKVGKTG